MPWALAFHPNQLAKTPRGGFRLMVPPILLKESQIPAAIDQDWIVLGRESDVLSEPLPKPSMDMTLLSNPRRPDSDDGDDAA